MNVLNDTLRVNVRPKDPDLSTDEETEDLKEQVLYHGKIINGYTTNPDKWMAAWDDQLWTTWCMIRNFRDEGGFDFMDKIQSYADWCSLVFENSTH